MLGELQPWGLSAALVRVLGELQPWGLSAALVRGLGQGLIPRHRALRPRDWVVRTSDHAKVCQAEDANSCAADQCNLPHPAACTLTEETWLAVGM